MEILENVSLAEHTTFHIGGSARFFSHVQTIESLKQALFFAKEKNIPVFILGGGSNVLFSDSGFPGLVIHPEFAGMDIIDEDAAFVYLQIGAGEEWDKVVEMAVRNGWWGIENLSHIPGDFGAFSVQNVGAYGQEASQVIVSVEGMDMETFEIKTFTNPDCKFTYRRSIFNTAEKGKYIILSAILQLSKMPKPNVSYGDVKKYFEERAVDNPSQQQIREAIIEIRNAKFPYPTEAINGNAGSFFRGPIITSDQLQNIETAVASRFGPDASAKLEKMKDRLQVPQGYKTPTAFLMELAGLKGLQVGGAKINEPHPAIMLNATGTAAAEDVLQLRDIVLGNIKQEFGIALEVEPELVGM